VGIRIFSLGEADDGPVLGLAVGTGIEGVVAAGEAHATTRAITTVGRRRARIR